MKTKTALAVALLLAGCAAPPGFEQHSDLLICGEAEVSIVDVRADGCVLWSWKAADHPELPEALRKKFGSTDECKPVSGGRKVLITSSGGAVALVERPSGKVLFSAAAVNAHSAEVLPGNRVVVASSTGVGGNKLLLFDLAKSDQVVAADDLPGAHGVVWDPERNRLWALGETEFRSYEVLADRATGSLLLTRRWTCELPNPDGHDLRAQPGTPDLTLTTGHHVWLFDRDLLSFRMHPTMGDLSGVKCVDVDPDGGATVYVKAGTSWWAEHVRFLGTERSLDFPKRKIYKARWISRAS
jgi:hypothetical protein